MELHAVPGSTTIQMKIERLFVSALSHSAGLVVDLLLPYMPATILKLNHPYTKDVTHLEN